MTAKASACGERFRYQARLIRAFRLASLPIGLLLAVSLLYGQESRVSSPDLLNSVVQSMEKAEARVQLPLRVTREYQLASPSGKDRPSQVVAEVDFSPPGRYAIQSHQGSGRAEQVVKNILQHEIETARSLEKIQSTAVTRQNYDFVYLGTAVLDGRPCRLLGISPKREQPELISGRVWVDQESFLIRKIEGNLAKSPSWWIKSVHVQASFSSFQDTWMQTSVDAVADVRCFGMRELTSKVLSYDTAPLAAHNFSRSIRLLPATGVH